MKVTTRRRCVGSVVGLFIASTLVGQAAAGTINFDFSSSPDPRLLDTNNPTNYKIEGGVFKTRTFTNSQQYGTFPVTYGGGDFTLSFDIEVLTRTTGDTNFGLFSSSRKSNQPSPGDPTIYVIYGGFEQGLGLRGFDASGAFFDLTSPANLFGPFALNTVYHNEVTYNATTKIATLSVSSPTNPTFFSGSVSIPGGLPTLPHLGVSSLGSWAQSNRFQEAHFDNVSATGFSAVPEPSSIILLGIGAVSLIGYGLRRKQKQIV